MLSELVREEDSLLDYKSTYRGSLTEVDVTPDILAMQVRGGEARGQQRHLLC